MDQYDAYYLDRLREKPLPVIYARMNDEAKTRTYIDPKTGRTVGTYSTRNWVRLSAARCWRATRCAC